MKSYHNHRQYSRSQVAISATLIPASGKPFGVTVIDLSMGGVFLRTDQKLIVGSTCQISILFGHFKHELPLIAEAIVVRLLEHGIALKFASISIEAVEPMQHLIVEHAENPEQSQFEFSKQGGWAFNPR